MLNIAEWIGNLLILGLTVVVWVGVIIVMVMVAITIKEIFEHYRGK